MSEREYRYVEDMSDEEVYSKMGISEKISEGDLYENRGHRVYVALDSKNRVIAVGYSGPKNTELKARARGCVSPMVVPGFQVNQEIRDKHNLLLDKSLEKRAKEDLERKLNANKE